MTSSTRTDLSLESLVHQQEVLREVIESISGELDLRRLLTGIVRHACDLIGADRGSVGLVDTGREVMRTEAVFRMPAGELGLELPPGEGLAGRVYETGAPVTLGRYGDLDRPALAGVEEDAVLGVPIEWRGDVIGFLGIGADAPHQFSPSDLELLTLFARHASIAIVNAQLVDRERRRASRIEAIGRVSRLVTASLSLDEILRTAVESVVESLGFYSAGLFLPVSDDRSKLVLIDRQGDPVSIEIGTYSQRVGEGVIGAAARDRKAILVADIHDDPRYIAFPGEETLDIRSEIAMPIVLGERLLGVLNVEAGRRLGQEDVDGLEIVADQLAVAIETARLFEERRELAAIEERNRLAGELHDSVSQLLFSQSLVAQSLETAWRRDPDEGARRVERLLELGDAARTEMRALLTELRPRDENYRATQLQRTLPDTARIEREGLIEALRHYCDRVAMDGLEVEFEVDGYELQPIDFEVGLFRIAQEAIHNVVKHARADRATLALEADAERLEMRIEDAGRGFLMESVGARKRTDGSRGGIGLSSMRRRAEALGGVLHIESALDRGTKIEISVPTGGSRMQQRAPR